MYQLDWGLERQHWTKEMTDQSPGNPLKLMLFKATEIYLPSIAKRTDFFKLTVKTSESIFIFINFQSFLTIYESIMCACLESTSKEEEEMKFIIVCCMRCDVWKLFHIYMGQLGNQEVNRHISGSCTSIYKKNFSCMTFNA